MDFLWYCTNYPILKLPSAANMCKFESQQLFPLMPPLVTARNRFCGAPRVANLIQHVQDRNYLLISKLLIE